MTRSAAAMPRACVVMSRSSTAFTPLPHDGTMHAPSSIGNTRDRGSGGGGKPPGGDGHRCRRRFAHRSLWGAEHLLMSGYIALCVTIVEPVNEAPVEQRPHDH